MNQSVNGSGYLRKWPRTYVGYRQGRSPPSAGELDEWSYTLVEELEVEYPRIVDLMDPLVGHTRSDSRGSCP